MRKKTDKKRQAILDVAEELFRTKGFDNTSMAEINARVGGSKSTLYNYFSSKDELFVECHMLADHYLKDVLSSLYDQPDLRKALQILAERSIRIMCLPKTLASRRLIIFQAERSGVGRIFFEKVKTLESELADYLSAAMDRGKLLQSDPWLATQHLVGLIQSGLPEQCLLAACPAPPEESAIQADAERAITTFLRAYAPQIMSS